MEEEIVTNEEGQCYFSLGYDTDSSGLAYSKDDVDTTIVDTNEFGIIKEADEEREIEIDLDELRQALASNCKTGKLKVTVTGRERSIFDKIFNW